MLGIEVEKAKHGDIIVLNVDESNFREGYNLLSKKHVVNEVVRHSLKANRFVCS